MTSGVRRGCAAHAALLIAALMTSLAAAGTDTADQIPVAPRARRPADAAVPAEYGRRRSRRRRRFETGGTVSVAKAASPGAVEGTVSVAKAASPGAVAAWTARHDTCNGHGVFNPPIDQCRCTAGWTGRRCELRQNRPCNKAGKAPEYLEPVTTVGICAGNCDEDRGLCYCAGLATPFQRPLPHMCLPMAHVDARLPDGRPVYPADPLPVDRAVTERREQAERLVRQRIATRREGKGRGEAESASAPRNCSGAPAGARCWSRLKRDTEAVAAQSGWARLVWETPSPAKPHLANWSSPWGKPLDLLYGVRNEHGERPAPSAAEAAAMRRGWPTPNASVSKGWCEIASQQEWNERRAAGGRMSIRCSMCYEGWTGPLCETPRQAFCLRDCSGHGWCDSGFCWCEDGWFGVDCSQHRSRPPPPPLSEQQRLPSPARESALRVYVYDMPSEFTTRNLQYRCATYIYIYIYIYIYVYIYI